jgi:sterol 14-demethylase
VKVSVAGLRMGLLLRKHVEARRHAEPTTDAIDVLVARGEKTSDIVMFVAALFFAGIATTGMISSWALVDLAIHPEWREKCKKEIQDLLSRHFHDPTSSATVCEKLIAVHVSAWEDELPTLDACIRESHRIVFSGIIIRRNAGDDLNLAGGVVKRGDFLAYPLGDVHLNPEYYPEPLKYDPGRWLRPDPVSKDDRPFLGWGAGRHPCSGMKVAKLEMKWIIAMFLMRYEYELVDGDGKFPDPLPVSDRNAPQMRPRGPPVYFKFKKVME